MKNLVSRKLAQVLSRSSLLVKLSRLIVKAHDNDGNANIKSNGELTLLTYISKNCAYIFGSSRLTFFDVGANVGHYTKLLHEKFDAQKSWIYSFDPSPDNVIQITNKLLTNVTVVETAISDFNGNADFYENVDRSSSSVDSLYDMNNIGYPTSSTVRSVRVSTIDFLCEENRVKKINLLKLDIEGNELKALLGSEQMLRTNSIDLIQFEFGHAARASRILLRDIILLLERFNFEIYVIKPKCIEKVQYDPFYENRYNMANFLAVHHSKRSSFSSLIR